MKISISNIAWDIENDETVSRIISSRGVDAIDIAPGKYFPVPENASNAQIDTVAAWWRDRGIRIVGMQSLLFGTSGLNIFTIDGSRAVLLKRLEAICRIAGRLGAERLVFGSPGCRDRSGLTDSKALEISTIFFRELGSMAMENGVIFCLEPNPPEYGANFMTDSASTAAVVLAVDHPAVRMQIDTGAITMNRENGRDAIVNYAAIVGHVHLSEPRLVPLGEGCTKHDELAPLIQHYLPDHFATVEMLIPSNALTSEAIARALDLAIKHYRSPFDGDLGVDA